jgi:hypothetical protein
MSRSISLGAALVAGSCALLLSGAALALCAVPTAGFGGGLSGASAVTAQGCFVGVDQNGGAGSTNASAASTDAASGVTLSASADLTTGVLAAYSPEGIASASLWDTFTFSGLPAGGASIVATLSLAGTLTGSSFLIANLEAGTPADFAAGFPLIQASFPGAGNTSLPATISVSFDAMNGVGETLFADILAHGVGGVANFSDPPTLSLALPAGADVVTAGGFDNFAQSSAVPEPSTWALLLMGFAGFGLARYFRARAARRACSRPLRV